MKSRLLGATSILALLLQAACAQSLSVAPLALTDKEFAQLSLELSEKPGYFDTDNLISNENSYQHVVPALRRMVVPGGAYLGVGPDQNFTYIAHTRPAVAFIIDIRQENLLQHLYFKELFRRSASRWQYLAQLLGRRLPEDFELAQEAGADELCNALDQVAADTDYAAGIFDSVWEDLRSRFPTLLAEQDRRAMQRIAWPFFISGLDLKFHSYGRPPRVSYPNLRELLLERDLDGNQNSYLATHEAFARIRQMQLDNRIVPVVGDLAGPSALRKIGRYLEKHDLRVSSFYTSNVEFYLFNNQTFDRYTDNVGSLPISDNSLLIRSYFSYWRQPHPETVPGYPVTSLLQPIGVFLKRQREHPDRDYLQLIFFDFVPIFSAR